MFVPYYVRKNSQQDPLILAERGSRQHFDFGSQNPFENLAQWISTQILNRMEMWRLQAHTKWSQQFGEINFPIFHGNHTCETIASVIHRIHYFRMVLKALTKW